MDVSKKINTLLEAGPWISGFKDSLFVIKYGGEQLSSQHNLSNIAEDIVFLKRVGINPIVIHGGGPQIDRALNDQGVSFAKKDGVRVYTRQILGISSTVLSKISLDLAQAILSKIKDSENFQPFIVPSKHIMMKQNRSLGLVGEVTAINGYFLNEQINKGAIPIISPFGLTEPYLDSKHNQELLNANADDVTAPVAQLLSAKKLIVVTKEGGVRDRNKKIIPHLTIDEAYRLIEQDVIKDGMIPKVLGCLNSHNVGNVHIIGPQAHGLLREVFTDKGIGTEIVRV